MACAIEFDPASRFVAHRMKCKAIAFGITNAHICHCRAACCGWVSTSMQVSVEARQASSVKESLLRFYVNNCLENVVSHISRFYVPSCQLLHSLSCVCHAVMSLPRPAGAIFRADITKVARVQYRSSMYFAVVLVNVLAWFVFVRLAACLLSCLLRTCVLRFSFVWLCFRCWPFDPMNCKWCVVFEFPVRNPGTQGYAKGPSMAP